jgi:hypothetical protein
MQEPAFAGINRLFSRLVIQDNEGWHYKLNSVWAEVTHSNINDLHETGRDQINWDNHSVNGCSRSVPRTVLFCPFYGVLPGRSTSAFYRMKAPVPVDVTKVPATRSAKGRALHDHTLGGIELSIGIEAAQKHHGGNGAAKHRPPPLPCIGQCDGVADKPGSSRKLLKTRPQCGPANCARKRHEGGSRPERYFQQGPPGRLSSVAAGRSRKPRRF